MKFIVLYILVVIVLYVMLSSIMDLEESELEKTLRKLSDRMWKS